MRPALLVLVCFGVSIVAQASVSAQASAFARAALTASYGVTSPKPPAFQGGGGGPAQPSAAAPAPVQASAPAVTPAQAAASPDAAPAPPPNYAYSPDSRRDPFLSLLNRGTSDSRTGNGAARPEGIAGLAVDEVVVRGIVQSRSGWVAMIGAPNGKTYTLRAGDRLMDGSVQAINAQAVILMQEVNDPLSLEKQREVRKYLRGEVK